MPSRSLRCPINQQMGQLRLTSPKFPMKRYSWIIPKLRKKLNKHRFYDRSRFCVFNSHYSNCINFLDEYRIIIPYLGVTCLHPRAQPFARNISTPKASKLRFSIRCTQKSYLRVVRDNNGASRNSILTWNNVVNQRAPRTLYPTLVCDVGVMETTSRGCSVARLSVPVRKRCNTIMTPRAPCKYM